MEKIFKSEEINGFRYRIEPKSSKQANVSVWKGDTCRNSTFRSRNANETIDQFVIRLHSEAYDTLKEYSGDEKDYQNFIERLNHESLVKTGHLKNHLESK